jgi:glycine/D-amino acid oxidase-like deaminating enzyme
MPLSSPIISQGLPTELAGAWWYAEEGQVEPRSLSQNLLMAAREAGVDIQEGVEVQGFVQRSGQVQQVQTTAGHLRADHYVLATGAWSNDLLPIPVKPLKGQMAAVQVPTWIPPTHNRSSASCLAKIRFTSCPAAMAASCWAPPARMSAFTPGITAAGMAHLFSKAVALYPPLRDFPVQETWWGFRPTTPDEAPILGPSTCQNLTLATGHHRNGILLMPITAEIVSDYILGRVTPLLAPFTWQRFERFDARAPCPFTHVISYDFTGYPHLP